MEKLEEVCIDDGEPTKVIRVGKNLPLIVKEKIVSIIKEKSDVLAWSHSNITGISPHLIHHAMIIDPKADSVRQKRRPLNLLRSEAVKIEVDTLTNIDFLMEALYPIWLANSMLVPKPYGT
uniref:Uncharacterized protein n=1 Tax=Cannabis sativa TaxID=3483 RepID=A0A803PQW5_CANSA